MVKTPRSSPGVITAKVKMTSYSAVVTSKGKDAFLVEYDTGIEVVRQWLFPGSHDLLAWWAARSKEAVPSSLGYLVAQACKGKVKPTAEVSFVREGRWAKVVGTKVGDWPKEFHDLMKQVREVFGEVEIIRVQA